VSCWAASKEEINSGLNLLGKFLVVCIRIIIEGSIIVVSITSVVTIWQFSNNFIVKNVSKIFEGIKRNWFVVVVDILGVAAFITLTG